MKLQAIKQVVTSKTGRTMLKLRKNSPHILFGAGVVGVVATAVTAASATLKVENVLDEHAANMKKINQAAAQHPEKYSEKDANKDRAVVYAKTIVGLGKLYGPTFILGVASIGCLAGSHRILTVRNVALTATLGSVEKAFDRYRQRVIDEFGADKDREYRFSSETVEVIEETNTGPQPKDLTRQTVKPGGEYLYAKLFGPDNKNWDRKPEYNVMFLRTQQQWANDLLRSRGHVFLNEVYDMLGMDRTRAGAVVGWLHDSDGDGFVDFGIWDPAREFQFLDFVTGREGSILLDFNVDGNIWDKI